MKFPYEGRSHMTFPYERHSHMTNLYGCQKGLIVRHMGIGGYQCSPTPDEPFPVVETASIAMVIAAQRS